MIRSILLALVLLLSTSSMATAQEGSPGAERKWSVSTGLGFASSVGVGRLSQSGFNWQIDAQYRITDSIAAGLMMQVIPVTGATVFAMVPEVIYYFGFLQNNSNEFVSNLVPYAGVGLGLSHVGADFGPFSDNALIVPLIVGVEYNINEHFAATSDMRFNIIGGSIVNEHFYYSWQIAGIRYRF